VVAASVAAEHGKLKVVAPPSMALDPLGQAALRVIGYLGTQIGEIPLDPAVSRQLDAIEENLIAEANCPSRGAYPASPTC
jgi:hypothetical protein